MLTKTVPVAAYKWLVCFLLEKSHNRLKEQRTLNTDEFEARNNSQARHTHTHILYIFIYREISLYVLNRNRFVCVRVCIFRFTTAALWPWPTLNTTASKGFMTSQRIKAHQLVSDLCLANCVVCMACGASATTWPHFIRVCI